MVSNPQDLQLIDRFLLDGLSHHELAEFNKRLGSDPAFAQLLKEEKRLRKGIEYSSLKQMAQTLEQLEASLSKEEKTTISMATTSWWSGAGLKIAASILLLVSASAVIYYFLRNDHPTDPRVAFEDHFKPSASSDFFPVTRGSEAPADLVDSAFRQYDAGNFKEALILFHQIPASQQDDVLQFYIANAALANGDTKQALPILKALSQNKESVIHFSAVWYLALCYLKDNNLGDARVTLNELKTVNNSYQQESSELLNEISE